MRVFGVFGNEALSPLGIERIRLRLCGRRGNDVDVRSDVSEHEANRCVHFPRQLFIGDVKRCDRVLGKVAIPVGVLRGDAVECRDDRCGVMQCPVTRVAGVPRVRSAHYPVAKLSVDDPRMVRVFGRPDCHLCRITEDRIGSILGPGSDVRVESIDIESDPELFRRLLERIPVVEVDGRVVSELEFDEEAFRGALDPAPGRPGQ